MIGEEECFDLKAWFCVSDEFDLVRITKAILKAIDPTISDENDLNLLQLKLKERLNRNVDSKNNKNTYLLFLRNQFRQNRSMSSMLQNIIPITRIENSFTVRTPFSYLCKYKSDSLLFRDKNSILNYPLMYV